MRHNKMENGYMRYSRISYRLKLYSKMYAEKPAIVCEDDSITFSELFEKLEKRGEELVSQNIKVLYIKNIRCIDTVIDMLAAVCVMIPYQIVDENAELEYDVPEYINWNIPMYLIKTSGTTGEKKTVTRYLDDFEWFMFNYKERIGFKSSDVILNQLDFSFDASAKDIYGMAFSGATLVIGNREKLNYPIEFLNTVKKYNVTHFQTTPYFVKCMAKLDAFANEAPSLKAVFLVGDVMKSKYINYWIEKIPGVVIFNLYGVSESTGSHMIFKTKKPIELEYVPLSTRWNNRSYIETDGEIVLYTPSGKHYTGDYVSAIPRKTLRAKELCMFVGRKDNLRKIRGYRISLEEIERAMCNATGVEEAICEIVEDEIYALYEGDSDMKVIKKSLKSLLPEYCQPVHLKQVDSLPVNENGKADRKKIIELFE